MLVVCVYNDGMKNRLTINNIYNIDYIDSIRYSLICDTGNRVTFHGDFNSNRIFKPLSELRKSKLSKVVV